jgi:hypothetical protein
MVCYIVRIISSFPAGREGRCGNKHVCAMLMLYHVYIISYSMSVNPTCAIHVDEVFEFLFRSGLSLNSC